MINWIKDLLKNKKSKGIEPNKDTKKKTEETDSTKIIDQDEKNADDEISSNILEKANKSTQENAGQSLTSSTSGVSSIMTTIAERSTPDTSVISQPTAELLDIFLEEGNVIAKQLALDIPKLKDNYFNEALIGDIRRAFHTLKGSGRMVGLNVFGEFAWQHEEFLNKVISGEIALNDVTQALFNQALQLVEKTVTNEPFVEEREALLLSAAQAKTMREILLSGDSLSSLTNPSSGKE